MRDHSYKNNVFIYNETQKMYETLSAQSPEKMKEYSVTLSGIANGNKRYAGVLRGLKNPYYMARKNAFEKQFRDSVLSKPELNKKYGDLWDKIAGTRAEMSRIADENAAISRTKLIYSDYDLIAQKLIELAEELKKPDSAAAASYLGPELEKKIQFNFPA